MEIKESNRYLRKFRGFLCIMQGEEELGRVVIDDLSSVILSASHAVLSKQVLVALAEASIPLIVCGSNYHPVAMSLPYATHHHFKRIQDSQISCSKPLKKRLWKALVQEKIEAQSLALKVINGHLDKTARTLKVLKNKVGSGDPFNHEAQAAKLYWKSLMNEGFSRNHESVDRSNVLLNYGYSVIRGACCRAIAGAGLTPALGLHHSNQYNPFCLADDLMEPFRPLVDIVVVKLLNTEKSDIDTNDKKSLVSILQQPVVVDDHKTVVAKALQNLAFSLVESYSVKSNCLKFYTLDAAESTLS